MLEQNKKVRRGEREDRKEEEGKQASHWRPRAQQQKMCGYFGVG